MGIDAEMLVRTTAKVTDADIKRWRYEIASAFGADMFWIFKPSEGDAHAQFPLELVDVYEQDGDDITPLPGETFIRVHPATRYYGEGYERGDLPFLITLAMWLERKIPDAVVLYGGDSSGVCAEPFDEAARNKLFDHFANVDHRPYVGGFDIAGPADMKHAVVCDFCKVPMVRYGWGGAGNTEYGAYHCRGCGDKVETRDGGQTYAKVKENQRV